LWNWFVSWLMPVFERVQEVLIGQPWNEQAATPLRRARKLGWYTAGYI